MMSLPRLAFTAFGALAVSACGSSQDSAANGKAENSRILEGSVSDEMIPFEKLRSEPPPAKIVDGEGKGGPGGSSAGSASRPSSEAASPAQPAVAETPQSASPDLPQE